MLRFILLAIYLIIFFILTLPLLLTALILKKCSPKLGDSLSHRCTKFFFKSVLFFAGTKVEVRGIENISDKPAGVFVANHRSYFDIVITYAYLDRSVGFISKDGVNKVPVLRAWMNLIYCLFIDRKDLKAGVKTILHAAQLIKEGHSMFIFPEGTRGKEEGKTGTFKEGSLKMAQKADCLIYPIALSNTAKIWEEHPSKLKPTKVIMEIGKPIDTKSLEPEDQKHLGAYSQKVIQTMLDTHTN